MLENGFKPDFPPAVQLEIATLDDEDVDAAGRRVPKDLRKLLWSSIDNRESRDLDQIEYAERLPNGVIRLLVGIADVDSLVPKGSAIDLHAAENTTSVYTGVAVFPMLPDRLSTDLTSLNEGEDRLAIVIDLDIVEDGSIVREDAYRALVRNQAKLAYENVGAWLAGEGKLPPRALRIDGLEEQLALHGELARRLAGFRQRAGAIAVETVEARTVMSHGKPRRWDRIVSLAAEMGEVLPEKPDGVALSQFLARRRAAEPQQFGDLSLTVVKLLGPGEYVLERRFTRRGDSDHFGLAATEYAHSTAPNRRYPDLVTQRLLKDADGEGGSPYTDDELTAIARHCTLQEDSARKVERTMRKKAAAVLMADRVGDSFVAVVTGASGKGTYVRVIRPPVEGRVVRGERGLDIGDTVRVTLARVDAERGFIDFEGSGESADVERKRERTARKRAAAARMSGRVGEQFDVEVTSATPKGTYVRLDDGSAEGRITRGYKGLNPGDRVSVTLINTDAVHGFIDFEYITPAASTKVERTRRKQAQARALSDRIGETFDAVVIGMNQKATYVKVAEPEAEGRLVRGASGLRVGDRARVMLLDADPKRGWIDFARDD
jgi:exoribonuclease-2